MNRERVSQLNGLDLAACQSRAPHVSARVWGLPSSLDHHRCLSQSISNFSSISLTKIRMATSCCSTGCI